MKFIVKGGRRHEQGLRKHKIQGTDGSEANDRMLQNFGRQI